jgi:hypothetical protein
MRALLVLTMFALGSNLGIVKVLQAEICLSLKRPQQIMSDVQCEGLNWEHG